MAPTWTIRRNSSVYRMIKRRLYTVRKRLIWLVMGRPHVDGLISDRMLVIFPMRRIGRGHTYRISVGARFILGTLNDSRIIRCFLLVFLHGVLQVCVLGIRHVVIGSHFVHGTRVLNKEVMRNFAINGLFAVGRLLLGCRHHVRLIFHRRHDIRFVLHDRHHIGLVFGSRHDVRLVFRYGHHVWKGVIRRGHFRHFLVHRQVGERGWRRYVRQLGKLLRQHLGIVFFLIFFHRRGKLFFIRLFRLFRLHILLNRCRQFFFGTGICFVAGDRFGIRIPVYTLGCNATDFRNVDHFPHKERVRIFELRVGVNHILERHTPGFGQFPKAVSLLDDMLMDDLIVVWNLYRFRRNFDFLSDRKLVWIGDLRVGVDNFLQRNAVFFRKLI